MLTQFHSQRLSLEGAGSSLSGAGCSSGSSQASGVGIPIVGYPLMQEIVGVSTLTLGIDGSILSIPSASELTLTQSFSSSSQASNINVPTASTPGLHHIYLYLYIY